MSGGKRAAGGPAHQPRTHERVWVRRGGYAVAPVIIVGLAFTMGMAAPTGAPVRLITIDEGAKARQAARGAKASEAVSRRPVRNERQGRKYLWRAGFERGLEPFQATPWNNAPESPRLSSQARAGRSSAAFTIPPGGSRCEVVPETSNFREGDRRRFIFSAMLSDDVGLNTDWQVIAQWKNDGVGSPPLAMVIEDGQFKIGGGWGWPGNTDNPTQPKRAYESLGEAITGRWVDWRVFIHFSSDPASGYVRVWRDGRLVLGRWHPPGGTLYPGLNSYLKIGYYRSSSIPGYGTVYHDAWVIRSPRD